ncbi:MAG: cupin domain-containing protein [Succinivibrionaceae bacterium]|nr:cupin domain-containing protein [Succinivibrionaceae bacterium]
MKNLTRISFDLNAVRTVFHDALGLSGCEASLNNFPANAAVPFVHAHRENEELYIVLKGAGELFLDGETVAIAAGDAFRVAPQGARCLKAGPQGLTAICVQAREGSLGAFTESDATIPEGVKSPWQE